VGPVTRLVIALCGVLGSSAGAATADVVFDSGLGSSSLDWSRVQPAVATVTRACVYDRAGYGWSDPGPNPRDSVRIVAELEVLLGRGGVAPPYVLVGHSFGGFNMRLFASENPDATAALVLIDSSHERQFEQFDDAGLPSVAPRAGEIIIDNPNVVPAALPTELLPLARSFTMRPGFVTALRSELGNLRRSANELRSAHLLPDVPLIVISHRIDENGPSARREKLWFGMQQELATRTSQGRLVVADTADHYVQLSDPKVVVDAIRTVVDRARPAHTASAHVPMGR
jgi:pimeloyl-ACP methyl ester carboxylesterase